MNTPEILTFVSPDKKEQAQALLARLETEKIPFLVRGMIFLAACIAGMFLTGTIYLLKIPFWLEGILLVGLGWVLCYKLQTASAVSRQALSYLGSLFALAGQFCLVAAYEKDIFHTHDFAYALIGVAVLSYPFFKGTWNRLFWCSVASIALFSLIEKYPFASLLMISLIAYGGGVSIFLMRLLNFYPAAYALLLLAGVIFGSQMKDMPYGFVFVPLVMSLGIWYTGFKNFDRKLEYTGIGCTVLSLFFVYYNLSLSLSFKTLPLVLTGCLLLVLRKKYAK